MAKLAPQLVPETSKTAVLIPCLNEELTIGKVVGEFKAALPSAEIYVFDNASTDRTVEVAHRAGATVVSSPIRGKGNVVRHMFEAVDADVYVLVDGDDTYPAAQAPQLIRTFYETHADMLVGTRTAHFENQSFRRFHLFSNHMVAKVISGMFRTKVTDVMSGYRVFSRRFVKSLPLSSRGFEIETEMTLQAAAKHFFIRETPISYGTRPEGSASKLNTYRDGYRVLKTIFLILKDYRPLVFFSVVCLVLALASLAAGIAPILDFYNYHYVYRVPRAILAAALATSSMMALAVGLILDTVRKYQEENFVLLKKQLIRRP